MGSSNEFWWIVSWNGQSGRFLNAHEGDLSTLRSLEGGFQVVDLNGDGIMEIVGKWVESAVSDSTTNITYSWNGQQYGRWPNPPQPIPGVGIPRDRVVVAIRSRVDRLHDFYRFTYVLENKFESLQKVDNIRVICLSDSVFNISSRTRWSGYFKKAVFVDWNTLFIHPNFVRQGQADSSFAFSSFGLPSILKCFVQGYNGASYSGDASTNSFQAFVVAPADPPSPFVADHFLDTLRTYITQSRALGWITSDQARNKYLRFVDTAKAYLQASIRGVTKARLDSAILSVYPDSVAGLLTSEACALIRFNTEYVLQKLREEDK
jgi:hypothetical protein